MKPPRPPRRNPGSVSPSPQKTILPTKRAPAPPPSKAVTSGRPRPRSAAANLSTPKSEISRAATPAQRVPIPSVLGPKDPHLEDINERRAEQKQARHRLVSMRILGALGSLLVVVAAVWVLFFSALLSLRAEAITVKNEGADIDLTAIHNTVVEQVGTPLLRINTVELRDTLLKNPTVAEIAINRTWPNGLTVAVTARIPRLAVKTTVGYDSVAADGVVTASGSAVSKGLVPVEFNGGTESLSVDQVTDILAVWDTLDESVRSQVSLLKLEGGSITLHLSGGAEVKWGDAADAQLKTKVLTLLLEQRPSGVYDVTDPTRPSVR